MVPPSRAAPLPMPPPFDWHGPRYCLHPKVFAPAHERYLKRLWINAIVVGLNAWFLPGLKAIPLGAEAGRELNSSQRKVVERVEHFLGVWWGLRPIEGRPAAKGAHIRKMLQEVLSSGFGSAGNESGMLFHPGCIQKLL